MTSGVGFAVMVETVGSDMVSISVEEALLLDLKALAERLGKPVEVLTAEALRGYVDLTRQLADDVAVARAQLARGEGVDIDDFDDALAARRRTP